MLLKQHICLKQLLSRLLNWILAVETEVYNLLHHPFFSGDQHRCLVEVKVLLAGAQVATELIPLTPTTEAVGSRYTIVLEELWVDGQEGALIPGDSRFTSLACL